jgi:hypothetical protein
LYPAFDVPTAPKMPDGEKRFLHRADERLCDSPLRLPDGGMTT